VITQEESTASFQLGETLFGEPKQVIGTTSEVAGQVAFDPADPSAAEISEILINARTFRTDSGNRDRAIRSSVVLDSGSDQHEFISFRPTAIEGLEGPVIVGVPQEFTVTGTLTIKGTEQTVAFEVVAALESEGRLSGRAQAIVTRTQFGIGIPNAPGVANVTEDVTIALDFVAVRT
jgi:polyisoprenoid-binding protein YceI